MKNVNHKNYYKTDEKVKENTVKKLSSNVTIKTVEHIKSNIVVRKNLAYYINKIILFFKRR